MVRRNCRFEVRLTKDEYYDLTKKARKAGLITGSLDIFGKQSNVDLDKRVVVFDIHGLGAQPKPTGLLVITDTKLNRVTLNWKRGKRTHVFTGEKYEASIDQQGLI